MNAFRNRSLPSLPTVFGFLAVALFVVRFLYAAAFVGTSVFDFDRLDSLVVFGLGAFATIAAMLAIVAPRGTGDRVTEKRWRLAGGVVAALVILGAIV